jgi:hypothetical protein
LDNGKKLVLGLLGVLILVLAYSGHSSSNTNISYSGTPQSDIVPANATVSGGSFIEGYLYNGAPYDYKNVHIEISGLDKYGNVISSKKATITLIKAKDSAYFTAYFTYTANIVSSNIKILNATKT